jgi:hypothetical protein
VGVMNKYEWEPEGPKQKYIMDNKMTPQERTSMSPTERAEKILSKVPSEYTFSGNGLRDAIATQIEKARLEGWNAAKEKAKGIAERNEYDGYTGEQRTVIAKLIGKMEPGK